MFINFNITNLSLEWLCQVSYNAHHSKAVKISITGALATPAQCQTFDIFETDGFFVDGPTANVI